MPPRPPVAVEPGAGAPAPIQPGHSWRERWPLIQRWLPHLVVLVVACLVTVAAHPNRQAAPVRSPQQHMGTDAYEPADLLLPVGPAPAEAPPESAPTPTDPTALRQLTLTQQGDYLAQPSLPITIVPQRVEVYSVQAGDSLASVAVKFQIDTRSLQWANGLADGAALAPGQQLKIPPVDGVLHVVRASDTLESIAASYGVAPEAITGYRPNQVRDAADLSPGRTIMVPGGKMPERSTVIMHTVQAGETIFTIAERYNITPETIIASNSLPDADFLQVGQKLAIMPVSGVGHIVQPGETVAELASRYSVSEAEIRSYGPNGLGGGVEVTAGQAVVIPGGKVPPTPTPVPPPTATPAPEPEVAPQPAPVQVAAVEAPVTRRAPEPEPTATPRPRPAAGPTGSFTWPATGSITTYFTWNGYGGHNGLDIANSMGTPIVAADGGVVTWAGWRNDGLGIAVFIDHGNGVQTWYGHFSRVVVSPGQRVSKGQLLGAMGSTGRSTGPHVHFMVVVGGGYRNPLAYLP